METIIRENEPVDLGDQVVKCSTYDKFSGLENLDVGSKYKMFEAAASDEPEERGPSSDRYGIMEKLKRLQEGGDVEDLLAELDEESETPHLIMYNNWNSFSSLLDFQ